MDAAMAEAQIPVLIVGGGPVGLGLALDLAWRGIRSTLIEQDPCTAPVLLAKAGTLNARTLEFCRRWGIADAVAHWGAPEDYPRDTVYCTSLSGRLVGRDRSPSQRDRRPPEASPEMLQKCPQHVFDPLLAQAVAAHGLTELRHGMRLLGFAADDSGVSVRVARVADGFETTLRAGYLVGCDGAASRVRQQLGIAFEGPTLDYSVSAMLRIDGLERHHRFGRAERFMFLGPEGTWANMTSVDFQGLWRFTLVGSEERLDPATLDLQPYLARAFGTAEVPCEVLRIVPWRRSQCTAARYVQGRVALAGDAAHTTSPTGGHGVNTGLGDAVGLAWVLQALVEGWGGPELLRAYEAERRPIAIRNSGSSTRNYQGWVRRGEDYALIDADGAAGDDARERIGQQLSTLLYPEWNSLGIALGYRYVGSSAVIDDGSPEPPDDPSICVRTARPGHLAPHAWLRDGRSTIDLFGRGFVLLRLGSDAPAADAIVAAAKRAGVPLRCETLLEPDVVALYERRLVLVRPDGHVAWRDDDVPADPDRVLARCCGRDLAVEALA
jgi:2-polyprenyl-6-methoxyphenol hydroxylase-like FAD-dependent oxidoreductase